MWKISRRRRRRRKLIGQRNTTVEETHTRDLEAVRKEPRERNTHSSLEGDIASPTEILEAS